MKMDKPVVIVYGDNNKINFGGDKSPLLRAAKIIGVSFIIGAAILAVSHCCPDECAAFIRLIISVAVDG